MKTSVLKLLPIVATLSLGLGMGGNVYAQAYAVSYNNVFDFTVTQAPIGSAEFFFPNTTVSKDSATLTGFTGVANSGPVDAAPINLGDSAKANNDFTLRGNSGGSYARADNWIRSQQTATPGTSAQSLNIVETRVVDSGNGAGTSDNASDTSFRTPFIIAGPTTLTFDFKADPYMQVVEDSTVSPSVARAGIASSITITDSLGTIVFSFEPTELNRQIVRNFGLTGTTTYDPSGGGAADVGNLNPASFLHFNTTTNPLANGEYILTLRVAEFAEVTRVAVPEPATLALLGLGLAGLGFARRKQA